MRMQAYWEDYVDSAMRVMGDMLDFAVHTLGMDGCLLYTSPSPRDYAASRMPSSA